MSRRTTIFGSILVGAVVLGLFLSTQGTSHPSAAGSLSWVSFDKGVALAKEQNKKILVDVYTDWCGWCKKMDAEVYSHPSVVRTLSTSFVTVKLNAESSNPITFQGRTVTEGEFAAGAGVTGYPTTLFLDASSNPITMLPGYVPAERFNPVLQYIGNDHYKSISFEEYQKRTNRTDK